MLSSTLWRAFTTPVTYALLLILLGTAVMQIRYVNKALQRFDSTQVIPIQFVMFTLCVILGSAILYRDFEKTTAEQAGKFVGGCLLTFFGVFLITSGRPHNNDDDEDVLSEADGVEETIGLTDHEGRPISEHRDGMVPRSRSRRSSKHSRVSFNDTSGPKSPAEDTEPPTPGAFSAASLGAESTPLLLETAHDERDPLIGTPPGRGIRTLSADLIMRGSAVTPPRKDGGGPGGYPPSGQFLTPQTRAHTLKANNPRSSTFISPSPLSSTVTTVVKDAFLRESDRPLKPKSSMRRIRNSIRASLFFNDDDDQDQPAMPGSEDNLTRGPYAQRFSDAEDAAATTPLGDEEEDLVRRRSRSVSDTLGDFFRTKKKSKRDISTMDVERGEGADNRPGPSL
jgi:magnesium transporter